jgi:hypothetical protein
VNSPPRELPSESVTLASLPFHLSVEDAVEIAELSDETLSNPEKKI